MSKRPHSGTLAAKRKGASMSLRAIAGGAVLTSFILMGGIARAASPEENRKMISDYYAAYASGDMDKVASFLPTTFYGTFPAIIRSPAPSAASRKWPLSFSSSGMAISGPS
ncbi:hypothetical protein Kim5_CH01197 [Rhizobium sp. Kim5]|nr:hypothetical protein Kim5_CH01197 [Rhizobium sp. Kim5]